MRAITMTVFGALSLATFVSPALAGDGVMISSATRTWQGEYVSDPGMADQSNQSVSVTRKLKFYMADASIDPSNPGTIAPDADDNIKEYLSSDVAQAIQSAQTEAAAQHKKVQDVLPQFLHQLRYKTVDCRQVTRTMIETLIGSSIKAVPASSGPDSLQYFNDEDQMDVAMTAKQLDAVTIMRDPSITWNDIEPRFTCRATSVSGSNAACGDLRIKFNPLEAQGGVFKGERAVVFDSDDCAKFPNMDFQACELLVQVQRCGLRYTEKADGKRTRLPTTRGLEDFLVGNRNQALREYQAGQSDTAQANPSDSRPDANSDFLSGFHAPNDPAAARPAN